MHELSDAALTGLVVEETGLSTESSSVKLTVSCIKHLKAFASFNVEPAPQGDSPAERTVTPYSGGAPPPGSGNETKRSLGLNLGYTINLNLPATSDPDVFDAIFKSLKQHLLRDDDA
jgi:hypothetical protein